MNAKEIADIDILDAPYLHNGHFPSADEIASLEDYEVVGTDDVAIIKVGDRVVIEASDMLFDGVATRLTLRPFDEPIYLIENAEDGEIWVNGWLADAIEVNGEPL